MSKLLYTILLLLFSHHAPGQASSSARASATIVVPVGATKEADLNFGNFTAGTNRGTIVLSKKGYRKSTGEITLLGNNEVVKLVSLNILGSNTYAYDIMLPAGLYIKRKEGSDSMVVNAFTISAKTAKTMVENLSIGATLTVAGSQAAGEYYCSTPFTVLINYN